MSKSSCYKARAVKVNIYIVLLTRVSPELKDGTVCFWRNIFSDKIKTLCRFCAQGLIIVRGNIYFLDK
ncbi:hypothetical protein CLHUN_22750 [Ruminiclostridium hungatei]|uniref:Uncharacterized protein n=1 Tax=Ruminiclostridium hungatei TaxID=48256 RepID=A0A1V4SK27_RUMHU|nr:hypothetical protein CLHUN_22750 [Ruminiclostridium hungatei]